MSHDQRPARVRVVAQPGVGRRSGDAVAGTASGATTSAATAAAGNPAASTAGGAAAKPASVILPVMLFLFGAIAAGVGLPLLGWL